MTRVMERRNLLPKDLVKMYIKLTGNPKYSPRKNILTQDKSIQRFFRLSKYKIIEIRIIEEFSGDSYYEVSITE